ncbi:rod shape-determining protein [bacterium]|nr:MAG: rod shape-determining protein [bacterium]
MRGFGVPIAVIHSLFPDVGIDLGTANTVIYERQSGVLLSEPSVVAFDARRGNRVVAVGAAARAMEGKVPDRIRVVHPLHAGTISDFRAAHTLVTTLLERALNLKGTLHPRVIIGVPGCATDIECKAVEEAVAQAGARKTVFVPQAVAAAVGAGLEVSQAHPSMVVDIGGGTTEVGMLALSGVVVLHSIKVGGESMDRAITARLRSDHFHIGSLTAERLKIQLGYAGRALGREPLRVSGMDQVAAGPAGRSIPEEMVGEALLESLEAIARSVRFVIEATPPDLAADLLETGIILTGGGALLPGLAGFLGERTRVPCSVAGEPLLCVARGAGEILATPSLLERVAPQADRLTRWYRSIRLGVKESYSP